MDNPESGSQQEDKSQSKSQVAEPTVENAVNEKTNIEQPVDTPKEASQEARWDINPNDLTKDDPLLNCLVILTKIEHNPFSAEALASGLPLEDNRLTPQLFIRAAKRAGLSAKMVKKDLNDISELLMPAVILLKDKQACILDKVDKERGIATIIQPDAGAAYSEISLATLEEQYLGYVLLTKAAYRFDARTEETFHERPKHWFWDVMKKVWFIYAEVLLASFLINSFALGSPLFVMNVYDRVVPNNAVETLWVLAIGIGIVFSFDFLIRMLRAYFIDMAGKKADVLLSATIFEHMLGIEMKARPESVGSFANNMQQFESFREFFTSATISTIIDLPFIVLFVLVIYYIGGILAIVPAVIVPLVIIVGLIIQVPLNRTVKESYRYTAQKHAMLIETLGAAETVKSVSAEGALQRKWEHVVGMASQLNIKVRAWSTTAVNFSSFAQQLAGVIVVILGVYQISEGNMTMGALIACTILTGRALAPLAQVAGLLTRYHQSMAALQSLDSVMKLPVERPMGKPRLHRPDLRGDIEFRDVSFAYPNQSVPALDRVSFSIKQGEKVGIIGRIGSGKTTIEKIIMGLYQPTEGTVLVDGTEINQIDPASLRRSIGYVPQDIVLFYGNVKENIVLGSPFVDDASIIKAASIAGVSEFVNRHPQGFDLPVGERGEKLSGGQRQAVAIARSVLLDPPILVLDEPTNMMDSKSEELIRRRLYEVSRDKTLILVTHKGSLLTLVDRILLIDGGQLVADGPRDVVLKALAEGKIKSPKGL